MNILYLPPIPYTGLRQRPQYLADGLAQIHEVTYLDPTVSMMKYLLKGGEKPEGYSRVEKTNLTVCRLDGHLSMHRSLEGIWSGFAAPERHQLKPFLQKADLVWIGFAPWYDLVRDYKGKIVYDRMDDNTLLATNPLMRRLVKKTESSLLCRADTLFVTACQFCDDATARSLHPILVPNAVDASQATEPQAPAMKKELGIRVFGYVGMIAHWFDLDAIRAILDASPENRVVLVGPEEIDRLNDPRVRYVGRVPKEQVGNWIASFDVCLYPFRPSPLLDTINPVKLYEYLAQNKPVLAVRSRETEAFGSLISTYETSEQLRMLAAQNQVPPFDSEEERRVFIQENTWDARIKTVLEEI